MGIPGDHTETLMAAELRLPRQSKATCLHQLEAEGAVRVQRDQLLTPLVEWCDRLEDTGK